MLPVSQFKWRNPAGHASRQVLGPPGVTYVTGFGCEAKDSAGSEWQTYKYLFIVFRIFIGPPLRADALFPFETTVLSIFRDGVSY